MKTLCGIGVYQLGCVCEAFSWLLTDVGGPSLLDAILGLVGLAV